MKKTLLPLCLFFALNISLYAQNAIPNFGYENWTAAGSHENPDNWGNTNVTIPLLGDITPATKTTDHHGVNYALKLQAIPVTIPLVGALTIPGVVGSGTISFNFTNPTLVGFTGGIPINFKPLELTGWYKYDNTAGPDTARIFVYFTHWNTTTMHTDTLAGGFQQWTGGQSAWTAFTIFVLPPLLLTATPDTTFIEVFSGGLTNPTPGALYLDDLAFNPINSGIEDPGLLAHRFNMFPVPASTITHISSDFNESENATLNIYDVTGRFIEAVDLNRNDLDLSVTDYHSGTYLFRVTDRSNSVIGNGRFAVIH